MTAMVKGASPVQDNCRLAAVLAMLLNSNKTRAWFELVDSKANPSDGLSRGGYQDPHALENLGAGTWRKAEASILSWRRLLRSSHYLLLAQLAALG